MNAALSHKFLFAQGICATNSGLFANYQLKRPKLKLNQLYSESLVSLRQISKKYYLVRE